MSDDAMKRAQEIAGKIGFLAHQKHADSFDKAIELIATAIRDADAAGYTRGIEDAARIAETECVPQDNQGVDPELLYKQAGALILVQATVGATKRSIAERPRALAGPSKESPELDALLARAREAVAAMTPEERDAMWQAQRESWVRGNPGIDKGPDARRTVTGGGANSRADRTLAALQEPSDELLNSLANSETMKLVAKAFLCAAAEWLRENVI